MQSCTYKSQVDIMGVKIKLKLVLAKWLILNFLHLEKGNSSKIHGLTQSGILRFRV